MRLSQAINLGAIHRKGKFGNFWRKVSGEIVIAGGGAVTMPEKYGWLPRLNPDMFFPGDTSLDAEGVTYAFDPKELGVADLKKLRKAVRGESGAYISAEGVDALLKYVEDKIKNQTTRDNANDGITVSIRSKTGTANSSVTVSAY